MGDERVRELEETLEAETLTQSPRSTVEPARSNESRRVAADALARLAEQAPGRPRYHFGEELGLGGTARVYVGTQLSLDRRVAIKTLKRELRDDDAATLRLLREAWLTGAVEHPGVVPIYDLGLDADGRPFIAMKRIRGTDWRTLMFDAAKVKELFGAGDLLEWNLRVLVQVCAALHAAHGRGIVHRDLKPENVMLGEAGEVYVVDWGIAVSVAESADARLPHASDAHELAGTPCYMAPEMLGSVPSRIGVRTDVYLVGAVLYDVLVGKPPHVGKTLIDVVRRVNESKPEIPGDVPPELADVIRRAMAKEPEQRYASAQEVARALEAFLEHRGSTRLAARAEERLAELERELALPDATGRRLAVYRVFGEARFGFQSALAAWDGNAAARAGIARAIRAMVHYELAAGEVKAAALHFGELEEKDEATAAKLAAATRRHADEQRRIEDLERLSREHDHAIGSRARWALALLLGTLWSVLPLLNQYSPYRNARGSIAGGSLAFLALLVFAAWMLRRSMLQTAVNRRLVGAAALALSSQAVLDLGAWLLDASVTTARVLLLFAWSLVTSLLAVTVDRRMALAGVAYFVGFLVAAAHPEWVFVVQSAAHCAFTVLLAWQWAPRAAKK